MDDEHAQVDPKYIADAQFCLQGFHLLRSLRYCVLLAGVRGSTLEMHFMRTPGGKYMFALRMLASSYRRPRKTNHFEYAMCVEWIESSLHCKTLQPTSKNSCQLAAAVCTIDYCSSEQKEDNESDLKALVEEGVYVNVYLYFLSSTIVG